MQSMIEVAEILMLAGIKEIAIRKESKNVV